MDQEVQKIIMGAPATIIACATLLGMIGKKLYDRYVKRTRDVTHSDIIEQAIEEVKAKLNSVADMQNDLSMLKKTMICQIRSNITRIYYKFINESSIPYYEHENLKEQYNEYRELGGNSYVETIVQQLLSKPVAAKEIINGGNKNED